MKPSLLTGDDEVDRATLWSEARKSKDGTYHSEDLKETVSKITQFVERKKSAGDSNLFHSSEDILENALDSKEHAGRVRGVGGHVTPSTYFNIGKGKKVDKELLARQERFIMAQEMRLRKLEEEFYNNREGKGSCSTKGIRPCPEGEEDPLMLNDDDVRIVNKGVAFKACKKKKRDEEIEMDTLDPDSVPLELYVLYCFFNFPRCNKVVNIQLDKDLFGHERDLHIHLEDVVPFCKLKPISYTCIVVFMWYLYKSYPHKLVDEIRFVDPYAIGFQPTIAMDDAIESRARYLSKRFNEILDDQICVAPCNVGEHWILTIIDQLKEEVCLLDPYYNGIHDAVWKQVVELALKMFNAKVDAGKNGRKNITWKVIKAPKQPDGRQCGFYVFRYILDLMQFDGIVNIEMIQSIFIGKNYSEMDIDEVRKEWASCIQQHMSTTRLGRALRKD